MTPKQYWIVKLGINKIWYLKNYKVATAEFVLSDDPREALKFLSFEDAENIRCIAVSQLYSNVEVRFINTEPSTEQHPIKSQGLNELKNAYDELELLRQRLNEYSQDLKKLYDEKHELNSTIDSLRQQLAECKR